MKAHNEGWLISRGTMSPNDQCRLLTRNGWFYYRIAIDEHFQNLIFGSAQPNHSRLPRPNLTLLATCRA